MSSTEGIDFVPRFRVIRLDGTPIEVEGEDGIEPDGGSLGLEERFQ